MDNKIQYDLLKTELMLTQQQIDKYDEMSSKTFRMDYKKRRDEVASILEHIFRTNALPAGVLSPRLPQHQPSSIAKHIPVVHVALPYLLLAVGSTILYFKF